ncbi:MAG: VWA-like domain-containing protein [Sulfurimonas sp.]|uniref:vWA domain-containing protein n=1 Tax=Sulfurimonas sp. TaxID=2022749 RepID=UPI0025FC93C6|nr:VWA-like domain-containing protein [Sulfurimonas sp.]MCK9491413.1 VWA-like domain-containing protein [Sulfurimonas sp.]
MSQIDNKISQAKSKLLVEYPFFGTLASKLELSKNDDIQAFKSNGKTLEYNDEFFSEISLAEMEFVLANAAMHATLAHESRKNSRSGWLWQLATDYAINDMLVENGLYRPDLAHYSKKFSGLYAEEIYAQLKEEFLRDELEYEAQDPDDIEKNEEQTANENQIVEDELFEEFAKAILEKEEKDSQLPTSLERFFTLKLNSKIDWRDELRVALDRFSKDDYTQMPPNKKFLYLGIYLPSATSEKFKLVVAIDSSGSINEELLGEFLSELNFLMNTIASYEIDLLVCDERIRSHTTFYGGDSLDAKIEGGGGTDFRPVFEFIKEELQDTKLLLYFSDLDGVFPKEEPPYSVKWITPKEKRVPFGELIVLRNEIV